jgi:hypothetical protein
LAEARQPDPETLRKYVELQGRTPCRKCKKTAWTLEPGFSSVRGGARVGIFAVMGSSAEDVTVGTFRCSCGNLFPRPLYTKEQLASQDFPAVTLDTKIENEETK